MTERRDETARRPGYRLTAPTRRPNEERRRVQVRRADEGGASGPAIVPGDPDHSRLIAAIDYEGLLEVRDPAVFTTALAQGIGKAKAFGCGLMLIRRA